MRNGTINGRTFAPNINGSRGSKFRPIFLIPLVVAVVAGAAIAIMRYAPSQIFYPNFDEQAYRELSGEGDAVAVSIPTEQGALKGYLFSNKYAKMVVTTSIRVLFGTENV